MLKPKPFDLIRDTFCDDYQFIEATGLRVPRKILRGIRQYNDTGLISLKKRIVLLCTCGRSRKTYDFQRMQATR